MNEYDDIKTINDIYKKERIENILSYRYNFKTFVNQVILSLLGILLSAGAGIIVIMILKGG